MADPWVRRVVIGDCVLYQGDCRDIIPRIGILSSVVTDPPYGMAFKSNYRIKKHKKIENDSDTSLLSYACKIPVTHSRYVWMRWNNLRDVDMPRSLITWIKNNHSMGDLKHEHGRKTEVCGFYKGENHFFPGKRPNDIITAPRTGNKLHPTQKPVGLMQTVVSWTDGVVCDPFMGSGSTLVACATSGRVGIGIELDPEYFDIAVERVRDAYS